MKIHRLRAATALFGINDSQKAAWCKAIEGLDEDEGASAQVALFPEDRAAPAQECDVVQIKLSGLQLRRPRQWGACWLTCELWGQLGLDEFWQPHLPPSRKGTRWLNVLKTLVADQFIDPGSECRLHRAWYDRSAMGDLLGEDFSVAHSHTLYRCLDKPLLLGLLRRPNLHAATLVDAIRARIEPLGGIELEPSPREPIRNALELDQ